jgi:hypothetical protein
VVPVPGQQRQIMGQSDSGNQAVAHADRLASPVELTSHVCRPLGSRAIERQNVQRIEQTPDGVTSLSFRGSTEKLGAAHSRRLEPLGVDVTRDLSLTG